MRRLAWLGGVIAALLLACGSPHAPPPHQLIIQIVGSGTGEVELSGVAGSLACTDSCARNIDDGGAPVRLVAVPSPGSTFDGWSGDCSGTTACDLTMSGDHDITATFSSVPASPPPPELKTVLVILTGDGWGRVTSDPAGIDCPGTCTVDVPVGSSVTLAARPDAGSSFAGWDVLSGCDAAERCEITADRDRITTGRFEANVPPPWARYTIRELPAVEGVAALLPRAVNAHGDVAGMYLRPCPPTPCPACGCYSQPSRAFLFEAATQTARRIGDDGTTYDQAATGMNDARQISMIVGDGSYDRAVRWEDDAMIALAALPSDTQPTECGALGIDSRGRIAGWCSGHAVLWVGSMPRDLGVGAATALNASGDVVGFVNTPGGFHLVAFEGEGARDLGTLGGWALPHGVNDAGRIVGSAEVPVAPGGLDQERAFVYDLPGGPLREPLNQPSRFLGVNGLGDAVGSYLSMTRSSDGAILWRDGMLVDLTKAVGDPSWVLVEATAINDCGQIVGWGTHGTEQRAFLLTPR